MTRSIAVFGLTLLFSALAFAQVNITDANYRVFDSQGGASSLDKIIEAAGKADVIFLGERHDDAVGHFIESEIFRRAFEAYGKERPVALSLEMFERDTQIVVDEYLQGLITEKKFLDDSRPWGNYKTDYRPLIEFAKANKLTVIAANAPRRYINMVSRGGRSSLDKLSKDAKRWLAPLPYAEASESYAKKFTALMSGSGEASMGIKNILDSQSLWDATMADSMARYLKKNKKALIVQVNGSFHSESRLGTVEHLLRYRPETKVLVVTMQYEDDFQHFDKAKDTNIGDFVILTDAKVPRSKR
ncbi:MAG: putative iron-regulated protein [Acidobacteria bacterium OLB17]|nr:MAG: putative iron-regulated protein [Acidobacteria bacterium OLB17]MCZ2390189.1 ChaN family lipoprotein [Acidobacteriota bacterium]